MDEKKLRLFAEVAQVAQVSVTEPPRAGVAPPPKGAEVFIAIVELASPALPRVPPRTGLMFPREGFVQLKVRPLKAVAS